MNISSKSSVYYNLEYSQPSYVDWYHNTFNRKSVLLFVFLILFNWLVSIFFSAWTILKIYPVLKCTTSFSNIFHRNGYAIRPYILPFTILFTIHSHTDTHRHALQYTHLNHTKIFSHLLKDLTRYIKNNIGRSFMSWHEELKLIDHSSFSTTLFIYANISGGN